MPSRTFVADLIQVRPHAGAHRVAIRAGISVAVPLLVLLAVGRLDWAMYAAFGAFTSLYGRNHVHLSRVRMQLSVGLLLVLSVTAGAMIATSDHRAWWSVPVAVVVAAVGVVMSELQDWHPVGPLFLIFGFGAVASIPGTWAQVPIAAGVAAASASFAVLVGGFGYVWRPTPHQPSPRLRLRRLWRTSLPRHVLRYAVAVLLAGGLATAIGIGHPYWAMVGAVVPMAAADRASQFVRGTHRLVGTLIGLGLSACLLALDLHGLGLVLLIAALQVGTELLVGRNYALALVLITPLALLMGQLVHPVPAGMLLFDRGVETLIGVLIGMGMGLLTKRE